MKPWSAEWKQEQLSQLYEEWLNCERCQLHSGRSNIVFGEGNVDADIMFIGEGPGEEEDRYGSPFIGEAGKLLNDLFKAVGIDRDDVFIANLVMCRPPNNRDPNKIEREACSPRLYRQIRLVDPLLIIPIGKVAMQALMGGDWKSILDNHNGHGRLGKAKIPAALHVEPLLYDAIPIIHPAYILRADAIDPDTKRWQENGPCHQTIMDLTRALDMVTFIKKQYKRARENVSER